MSSILKGIQLNEVNPHNYDSDWDYQNAVANSGRSRSRSSDSYDAHDAENDAYEMHKRFAATRARKEAEAKAAAEKAKTGEQGVSESVNYKADAEKLKKQGDMTGYHRTMVRHYDALADNATHRGDAQRYEALANKHHAASKGITEADEWEEETGKHQRFVEYAKKTLMRERDPKRRIETANYLSKQENKFFGSPISSAAEQTQFGSVNTGKAFTDLIKGIMSDIQDGRLHYEQDALNAAIWLEPEGKEFLQKAHTDFIEMMDHSRKEREQHAIALSGYQTKNLGGKVMGAPLKGGIVNDASARMTPEIFGVFELAEQEILRKKGEREDEQERQRNIAIWNALPGPLKLAAAAAVGKTPDQLEKILFAKSEIDAVAGLDASDFPKLAGSAKPTNNSVAEDMDGTEYTPKVGDEVLWRHSDPRSKMMPMPGTVLAVAPGKVKLKIYSKRMIQDRGTDTVVLDLNHYTVDPKPGVAGEQLDELSTNTLANYKKKAGADATSADKRGDYTRGNKRMSGIMQATKKEFANDAKGVAETTGDKPFDKMMTTIKQGTNKQKTADRKEQQKQTQQQARDAFGNMFGGGNPADKLKIREQGVAEEKQRLDPKCWSGYKKQGTKMKGGVRVNNCVPVKESAIMQGVKQLDEGWKEKLGAAALAGSMALGAAGAHARVVPGQDDPDINRLTGKPNVVQTAADTSTTQAEAPKGFSKEYLQKAANPERVGRFLISVEKAQELLKQAPNN